MMTNDNAELIGDANANASQRNMYDPTGVLLFKLASALKAAEAERDAALAGLAGAKAEALEDAAIDIVLTPVAEWKRHGNPGIRENGEADASAWLDARAAEYRK